MPGLPELFYTTVGGLTGSLITVIASQGKDRRVARAACHARLRQIFVLGAQTADLNEETRRNSFHDALVDFEAAALSAGLPHRVVDIYIELREEGYYAISASQLTTNEIFLEEWNQYIKDVMTLVVVTERQLKSFLWHPWKGRFFSPTQIGNLEVTCRRFLYDHDQLKDDLQTYVGRGIRWTLAQENGLGELHSSSEKVSSEANRAHENT